jgi:hypothetical protein
MCWRESSSLGRTKVLNVSRQNSVTYEKKGMLYKPDYSLYLLLL